MCFCGKSGIIFWVNVECIFLKKKKPTVIFLEQDTLHAPQVLWLLYCVDRCILQWDKSSKNSCVCLNKSKYISSLSLYNRLIHSCKWSVESVKIINCIILTACRHHKSSSRSNTTLICKCRYAGRQIKQNITCRLHHRDSPIVPANMLDWSVMFHWLSCENHLNNCQSYFLKGSFTKKSQSNEVHSNEEVIDLCTHPHTLPPWQ